MNYVGNPFQFPAILSLCPGIRGLERGIERAIGRINVIAYVEIESFIIENLVCEMEQGVLAPAPVWTDVKTFDGAPLLGKIHGLIGGYPCQPFSHAGQRGGTEDPRHLYPYISGIIKATRPVWCFFENVEGHLTLGYPEVSADLRNMGYAVEAGIYSAEEAGAPHQRNRLFILAIRKEFLEHARSTEPHWVSKSEERHSDTKIRESGNELADTGLLGREINEQRTTGVEQHSETLGNTHNTGGGTSGHGDNGFRQTKDERRNGQSFAGACGPGEELAETNNLNVQRNVRGNDDKEYGREQGGRQVRPQSLCDVWPARPGQPQHEWEEPRTVKSGMGITAHGYNFREDLLRAAGNSVVEQTAEIAFIDLLNKHMNG